jgi:hypothetical protein
MKPIVYVTLDPGMAPMEFTSSTSFSTWRPNSPAIVGAPFTVVGSVATGAFVAPPPLAVAELATLGIAAARTLTRSEIGAALPAGAMLLDVVHVTPAASAEHVQPLPLAELNVSPGGSASLTVVVPDVATLPVFPATMVYVPIAPTTNEPECDFTSVSAGAPAILVGSFALGVFAAPPPLASAELTTDLGAPLTLTVNAIGFPVAPAAIVAALVQVTF